ncbi:ELMO domain-containing protein 1 isoform X2 [Melospiza melodia melodia]|uniref:ELMO domain-containing protein 1 isoform X2 n=1 Tax=Melospiza melodia melodia TaxID=1914991 RepID=UPI002FD4B5ED
MKHFLRMFVQVCLYFYCKCLWRCLKFVVRKLTGQCELQRICYNTKPGAARTMKIEASLKGSKSKRLQTSVNVHPDAIEKTIDDIMELKRINPDVNPQLGVSLQACLLQIVGYRNLIAEVEKLRREPYDSENPQHEEMLLKLWKCLKPNSPLKARISKQWCEIGFQGDDPKTDFRGMGLLGLYNLVYFAEWDTEIAQQVLTDSLHPKYREVTKKELRYFFLFSKFSETLHVNKDQTTIWCVIILKSLLQHWEIHVLSFRPKLGRGTLGTYEHAYISKMKSTLILLK